MDWLNKLLDSALGGLPSAAVSLIPVHLKKQALERLGDRDPFKTISANHDLVRATRLAWIEAAQEILKEARAISGRGEWRSGNEAIKAFEFVIKDILSDARDEALDRRKHPGSSPIDIHVQVIIQGVPELVSPGDHQGAGAPVTSNFSRVLAELSGWQLSEIPTIYVQLADNGLATYGGGPNRSFGELVFAAFAELIKNSTKYPEAQQAFHLAMKQLGHEIGKSTLAAVRGLDGKLDSVIAGLDAFQVLQDGFDRHLKLLPQLVATTIETRTDIAEILRIVSQRDGVPFETIRAVLRGMGEAADLFDVGQLEQKLRVKAEEFKALTERLNRFSNSDPEVRRLRHVAAEELAKGRFPQADAFLAAAEAQDLSGLEDIELLAKQKRLSAAESRADRAAAAELRASPDGYREAANHYGEAALIASSADPAVARTHLRKKGRALTELGKQFGLREVLLEAISHFRTMEKNGDRRSNPFDWADVQLKLANALAQLGELDTDVAHLKEATLACRLTLEEWTQESAPHAWASTQSTLGSILSAIGERESGTERFEEALEVHRLTLNVWSREQTPLDWARAQNNIAVAHLRIGERQSAPKRIQDALEAFYLAIEEYDQKLHPFKWALIQSNIGMALLLLGQIHSDDSLVRESLLAQSHALEVLTQSRAPLEWAATLSMLSQGHRWLARRGDIRELEAAITTLRLALTELSQVRSPVSWARVQGNLGIALTELGAHEGDTVRLTEALEAFQEALKEWTLERMPFEWAKCSGNEGYATLILAKRLSDLSLALRALSLLDAASQALLREGHGASKLYEEKARKARELIGRLKS